MQFRWKRHCQSGAARSKLWALVELLPPGQYATMICVAFDLAEGRLSYAAAGAPAPLLRGPGAGWRMLDSAGIPLGVTADAVYPNRSEPFAPGSLLFLYSDALAETPLTAGGLLGEAGVAALAASSPPHGAKPFLERMVGQFRAAIAGEPSDDLTCVALHRVAGAVTATAGGVILP